MKVKRKDHPCHYLNFQSSAEVVNDAENGANIRMSLNWNLWSKQNYNSKISALCTTIPNFSWWFEKVQMFTASLWISSTILYITEYRIEKLECNNFKSYKRGYDIIWNILLL